MKMVQPSVDAGNFKVKDFRKVGEIKQDPRLTIKWEADVEYLKDNQVIYLGLSELIPTLKGNTDTSKQMTAGNIMTRMEN